MLSLSHANQWIDSFDDVEGVEEAVEKAMADLGLDQRAQDMLRTILRNAFRLRRREKTRDVERTTQLRDVFRGEKEVLPDFEDSMIELRQRRLDRTFAVIGEDGNPTGQRVSWGEATEQQHTLYMNFLRRSIIGIESTISEHREAIRLIRVHSVSCLNEIGSAA